jgi:hypothetical protein
VKQPLAQTNLQLYRQMLMAGYDACALDEINKAYLFAARQTSGMLRGSGKPFVCHLVGSASALCESGQPVHVIAAALLHAMYQERIPFGKNLDIERRRAILRERFGVECEALVYGYHTFDWLRLPQYLTRGREADLAVILMHLADALEDMLDEAMVMHGHSGETDTVVGTAAWRVRKWAALEPELVSTARAIGATFLAEQIGAWMDANKVPSLPHSLKTGKYTSFVAVPE